MSSFLICLAITLGVAAVTLFTGRLVVALFNVQWLRRGSVENHLFAMFLGTSVWVLIAGTLSLLDLFAPTIRNVLLGITAGLAAWVVLRGKWQLVVDGIDLVVLRNLALVATGILAVNQFSILWFHTYTPNNDTATYLSMAELLQNHSAADVVPVEQRNKLFECSHFLIFSDWFQMGAVHFLAVVRSFFPYLTSYQLFPAVAVWGLLLNAGGMYCLARWTFRMPRTYANMAAILPMLLSSPLVWSYHTGFYCQLYGTASFVFSMGLLSRLYVRNHWNWGSAIVFGLTLGTVLATYGAFATILTMGCVAFIIQAGRRAVAKHQTIDFLQFAAKATTCFVLMCNYGLYRTIQGILFTASLDGVGWHNNWSDFGFWGYAMGAYGREAVFSIYAIVATGLFFMGLKVAVRRRQQSVALLTCLAFFMVAVIYFRFFRTDPWTGEVGHTWNLFKLGKYAFPLIAVVITAGMWDVLKNFAYERRILIAGWFIVVCVCIPENLLNEIDEAYNMNRRIGPTPMLQASQFRDFVVGNGEGTIYCIYSYPRDNELGGSLLHPLTPKVVTWEELSESFEQFQPNDRFVSLQSPRFFAGSESLPFNYAMFDPNSTFVADIKTEKWTWLDGDVIYCWIGEEATEIKIWSHDTMDATIQFAIAPGPSIAKTEVCHIWGEGTGLPRAEWEVKQIQEISVPLKLTRGLNVFKVGCSDQADTMPDSSSKLLANIFDVKVIPHSKSIEAPSRQADKDSSNHDLR